MKLERTQQLLDACDVVGFVRTQRFVGQELEVIVEAFEDTGDMIEAVARSQAQAPDVDGLVHIPALTPENCSVGDVVRVRCYDTFCYELEAEPL